MRFEHLGDIAAELEICGPSQDLEEVSVVGVDVIRFLGERERQGTELARSRAA